MEIKEKQLNRNKGKALILLYKLASSMVFIWFSFEVLLFLFYLIGNYQNFLDNSQLLILRILSLSAFITFVLCFCSLVTLLFLLILKVYNWGNLIRIIPISIALVVNILFLSYSTIITQLSEGI
ncbi:MAG: hypothetical protein MJ179_09985 [Treponema sp.]|nr:hypothetical protein [Treponema sp.]